MDDLTKLHPEIANAIDALASIERTEYNDQTFTDQDVYLDGRDFRRCTFTRCRLFLALGSFDLSDSEFIDCAWLTGGPAEMVRTLDKRLTPPPEGMEGQVH